MKRILSLLMAVVLIMSLLCLPVGAKYQDYISTAYIQYGTTARDLRAYGLPIYLAYEVSSAPALDGSITPGEYGSTDAMNVAKIGSGLTMTNSSGTADYSAFAADFMNFSIASYLAYDDEYVYIAEEVKGDRAISIMTPNGLSTLNASVRIGMNQSPELPEAASRLSNSYSYAWDGSEFSSYACSSGNRTYKVIDGEISKTATLDDSLYGDWNRAKYKDNTVLNYTQNGNEHVYVFEYKIPIGDIAYSNYGNFDDGNAAKLMALSQIYGSYFFQVAVSRSSGSNSKTQVFLSTGFGGNTSLAPLAGGAPTTWADAVSKYWTANDGDSLSIPYVPTPIQFMGSYDPSVDPSFRLPSATSFQPGKVTTGYEFGVMKSIYKVGETVKFSVTPDGVDNTDPNEYDRRTVPAKFRVRNGDSTKLTGSFNADYATASFSTAGLPVGVNTLVVTFVEQVYLGGQWTDTDVSKNLSRNFTITGSVKGTVAQGSSQTGDNTALLILGVGVMLTSVAAFTVVAMKKRTSR